jgi:hypothetical protein
MLMKRRVLFISRINCIFSKLNGRLFCTVLTFSPLNRFTVLVCSNIYFSVGAFCQLHLLGFFFIVNVSERVFVSQMFRVVTVEKALINMIEEFTLNP